VDAAAELAGVTTEPTTSGEGGWFDPDDGVVKIEPSSVTRTDAVGDELRAFAAILGDMTGQWSVLTVNDEPLAGGNSDRVTVTTTSGLTAAELFDLARRADPDAFGGFTPLDTGVEGMTGASFVMMDDWGSTPENAALAAEKLGAQLEKEGHDGQVETQRTEAEFVGDAPEGEGYGPALRGAQRKDPERILRDARRRAEAILGHGREWQGGQAREGLTPVSERPFISRATS